MVIAKILLTTLVTFLPKGLAFGAKLVRADNVSGKIERNPKAINGLGSTTVATSLVALAVVYLNGRGIAIEPEMQNALIGLVSGLGGVYTVWRASRKAKD